MGDGIPVGVRKHGSAPGTQAIDRRIFLPLICHIHGLLFSERFRGMAVVNVYNQHGETGVADAAFLAASGEIVVVCHHGIVLSLI